MRAPVAGVKGTHDCRGGVGVTAHVQKAIAVHRFGGHGGLQLWSTDPCCIPCGMLVSVWAHLQLGVVWLPEAVAAACPAVIKDVLCTPRHPGHVPDRSRPSTGGESVPPQCQGLGANPRAAFAVRTAIRMRLQIQRHGTQQLAAPLLPNQHMLREPALFLDLQSLRDTAEMLMLSYSNHRRATAQHRLSINPML